MENAARGAAEIIERLAGDRGGPVRIVCGPGNNGGDGFAVARRLFALGRRVDVFVVANPGKISGDAKLNYEAWVGLGGRTSLVADADVDRLDGELRTAGVVVDALLGTGLDREVAGL